MRFGVHPNDHLRIWLSLDAYRVWNLLHRLPRVKKSLLAIHSCSICLYLMWGVPKLVVPNNHGKILLKMISTWGVQWGVPTFKETPTNSTRRNSMLSKSFQQTACSSCSSQPARVKSSLHRSEHGNPETINQKPSEAFWYGDFLKWWYPPNTPKWSFLVAFSHGCWGNPPF